MQVEVWSDVVCPWCYLGKRNLEAALAGFEHADEVTVTWRSFELDPTSPRRVDLPMVEILARKYGMTVAEAEAANARLTALAAEVGLEYHLDRVVPGNTFDAHRLLHLADRAGRGDALKERLLAAYFTEGRAVGERDTLASAAADVGLDPAEVDRVLDGDAFADDVRADEARAVELGCTGVPFTVVDGRLAVPGAQPPELLLRVLRRAWESAAAPAAGA